MAVSNKHKFVSAKTDGPDSTQVRPSDWNNEHDLELAGPALLGKPDAGTGAAVEIPLGAGLDFSGGAVRVAPGGLTATELNDGAVTTPKVLDGNITSPKLAPNISIAGTFGLAGDITPAQITANQDNYNPTGLDGASVLRLSTSASYNLTGIQGGADGRLLIVANVGANNLVLVHDATSTAANRLSLPGAMNLTLLPTESALLRYDATLSRWVAISSPVRAAFTAGDYSNLRIDVTGNATVDVDVDRLTVYDAAGRGFRLGTVDLTLDLSASGAGGRDTGSEASNTWYAVHVIYNPATSTIAGLLSTSASSPTLPSGYTYSRRVGWVRNDGSSNLFRTRQRNEKVAYIVGANPVTPRTLASGVAGNVTTPTWVSVPVGDFVPPTAKLVVVHLLAAGGFSANAAPNKSYGPGSSRTNPPPFVSTAEAGGSFSSRGELMLESSNIEWASNNAGNNLFVTGWEDNL